MTNNTAPRRACTFCVTVLSSILIHQYHPQPLVLILMMGTVSQRLLPISDAAPALAPPAAAFFYNRNKKRRSRNNNNNEEYIRPEFVAEALQKNHDLYYFGLGSNMLRSKLENRGINGTKIEVISFEPAVVPNYRLAFNLQGLPPLEPGMGSLEPIPALPPSPSTTTTASSTPSLSSSSHTDNNNNHHHRLDYDSAAVAASTTSLLEYEHQECHGALVKLTAENYVKVMASEGVKGDNDPNQGYEEIIVDAYPYSTYDDDDIKKQHRPRDPVKAVALRARKHVRLKTDPSPSLRYMTILRLGAKELNLLPSYQQFLDQHPVQKPLSPRYKNYVVYNLVCMTSLLNRRRQKSGGGGPPQRSFLSKLQTRLLFLVYVPSSDPSLLKCRLSELLTTAILFPGSSLGYSYCTIAKLITGHPVPALTRMMQFLAPAPAQEDSDYNTNSNSDSDSQK